MMSVKQARETSGCEEMIWSHALKLFGEERNFCNCTIILMWKTEDGHFSLYPFCVLAWHEFVESLIVGS